MSFMSPPALIASSTPCECIGSSGKYWNAIWLLLFIAVYGRLGNDAGWPASCPLTVRTLRGRKSASGMNAADTSPHAPQTQ